MSATAAKRLIPLFDRILIKKFEAVTKTKGGIVIPEKSTEQSPARNCCCCGT
ncbi:hypothetical protein NQ314_018013 [Rhamnusium bicolor]|uniref:10 kDa heat shock protein, mitochondrial n=1 Tax=Rhamnusium bicolor TaxID=1586634 RepID=A0AAV8WRA8_9CUCU|nr:hypothetical protein NQ314_018013 [Rhamnusium bicolor]